MTRRSIRMTLEEKAATLTILSHMAAAFLLFIPLAARAEYPPPVAVRVMSFNIRYGLADDGENHWDKRKDLVVETILDFDPDLLGTQETLAFQRDHVSAALPGHAVVAAGREDGREKGEMNALWYRRARFEALDSGHFWLSETPETAGSRGWDGAFPRMVTWVRLRDKRKITGRTLCFFNTHFDHMGPQARLESARLLRARADTAMVSDRLVITGDFNVGEGSPPYAALFGGPAGADLRDAWRVAYPRTAGPEGTFNEFKAGATTGDRIDWIAVSHGWRVVSAVIDRTMHDGRMPSDHYPVTAVVLPE